MKKYLLTCLTLFFAIFSFGQLDTIYSFNQKIGCLVKEITLDAIKYSYADEDLINNISKNAVQKIVFKNGRVQTFSEAIAIKEIHGVDDLDKVIITQIADEIKGLIKIGDLSTRANGTTVFSSEDRVRDRAFRKMKIEAAMLGASIVYLTSVKSDGNILRRDYISGSSSKTRLYGIAYTYQLPDTSAFFSAIKDKKVFKAVEEVIFWNNAPDFTKLEIYQDLRINKMYQENGVVFIEGALDGNSIIKFRLTSFYDGFFNIQYEERNIMYGYKIKIK